MEGDAPAADVLRGLAGDAPDFQRAGAREAESALPADVGAARGAARKRASPEAGRPDADEEQEERRAALTRKAAKEAADAEPAADLGAEAEEQEQEEPAEGAREGAKKRAAATQGERSPAKISRKSADIPAAQRDVDGAATGVAEAPGSAAPEGATEEAAASAKAKAKAAARAQTDQLEQPLDRGGVGSPPPAIVRAEQLQQPFDHGDVGSPPPAFVRAKGAAKAATAAKAKAKAKANAAAQANAKVAADVAAQGAAESATAAKAKAKAAAQADAKVAAEIAAAAKATKAAAKTKAKARATAQAHAEQEAADQDAENEAAAAEAAVQRRADKRQSAAAREPKPEIFAIEQFEQPLDRGDIGSPPSATVYAEGADDDDDFDCDATAGMTAKTKAKWYRSFAKALKSPAAETCGLASMASAIRTLPKCQKRAAKAALAKSWHLHGCVEGQYRTAEKLIKRAASKAETRFASQSVMIGMCGGRASFDEGLASGDLEEVKNSETGEFLYRCTIHTDSDMFATSKTMAAGNPDAQEVLEMLAASPDFEATGRVSLSGSSAASAAEPAPLPIRRRQSETSCRGRGSEKFAL